jgi:hypothetical protein
VKQEVAGLVEMGILDMNDVKMIRKNAVEHTFTKKV